MGDIIETWVAAFQPFLYYKMGGNGLWFEVMGRSKALVGLAKDCGRSQFWVEFSNPGKISIVENTEVKVSKTGLPFSLSENGYVKFWIGWDCKSVWAGIGDNLDEVITYPVTHMMKYATFTTDSPYGTNFRFEVPPLSLRMSKVLSEPTITTGKLEWKTCDDQLPDEAVIGGYIDGEIVYVVRAHYRNSLTPGVFIPSKGLAYIPWGGSDNPTHVFEALCGLNLKWKNTSELRAPVDAIEAGYSEVNREPLYVGRAFHQGNKIPGKVQLSHKVCYITYQGREIAVKNFEVLTEPRLNAHCANTFVQYHQDFDYESEEYEDDDGEVGPYHL